MIRNTLGMSLSLAMATLTFDCTDVSAATLTIVSEPAFGCRLPDAAHMRFMPCEPVATDAGDRARNPVDLFMPKIRQAVGGDGLERAERLFDVSGLGFDRQSGGRHDF